MSDVIAESAQAPAPSSPDLPTPESNAAQAHENALRWWQERGLPIDARPRPCPYCKREYLRPCGEEDHARCMNFKHLHAHLTT
ncbi:MAG TPA: hypothetical protein P5256_12075 [Beijerinckiaceae bacterium]|nr:hypothetical protein [Rhodoblastus sp.]HRY03861.1 hypothetical protein [Beijerinckiaceae bacterium]